MKNTRFLFICAALLVLFGLPGYASTITFLVTVDTTSLSGLGEIDMELVPGVGGALNVEANVSGFQTQARLGGNEGTYFDPATGSLTSNLNFNNSNIGQGYFHGYTFGDIFSFTLQLTGAGVGAGAGGLVDSAFRVFLYDDQVNLNQLLGGAVVEFVIAGSGDVTVNTLNGVATASEIPEPGTWMLVSSAALIGFGIRRLKR